MKFRRRSEPSTGPVVDPDASVPASATDSPAEPVAPRTDGPFDESEIAGDGVQRVDLGSLLVAPSEGRELRMQVDEKTGNVQAVMIAGEDGALELQVFAAPRNGDLWSTVRPQIQADITGRGGKADVIAEVRREVWPLIEEGSIAPVIGAKLRLTHANEALALMGGDESPGGKIVLVR